MKFKAPIFISLLFTIGVLSAWELYSFFSSPAGSQLTANLIGNVSDAAASGWSQTSGPLGGTVIRMVPHNGTIWASLYSGGIYELQKDGSWLQIAVGRGIPEVRAFDIVFDTTNTNIAYVPQTIKCIAKTTDNGGQWTGLCKNMPEDIKNTNLTSHSLALDPADSQTIYVVGHSFDQTSLLLVSTDGGEHWEKRHLFGRHYDFNHLLFYNGKMYLSTQDDGVFISSDKGNTWTALNKGLKNLITARFVNFKNSLYLLGARLQFNIREPGQIYRLKSDGSSWELVKGVADITGLATDGGTLFAGTMNAQLWTSKDGAKFTQKKALGLPSNDIGEIVNVNGKIYVGNGGNGIYVSSDGGDHFTEANTGMKSVATREVSVNPKDGNEIYVGQWDRLGFYWSKNGGKTYQRVATNQNILTLQPDPHDFSKVYLGGDQFFIGDVNKNQFTQKTKPGSNNSFMKSIAIDPGNSNHVLAGVAGEVAETPPGEGLWESTNQGKSWTRSQGIGNFAVYSILYNPGNPKIVYASALGSGVFKSTDGGSHFSAIGGPELKYTYRMAMSPSDPKMVIAASNTFFGQLSDADMYSGKYGGIFQSNDEGTTWKEITKGVRNYEGGDREEDFLGWLYNFGHMPNYEMILIDPKDSNHIIIGDHGENVIATHDDGATWEKEGADEMVPGGVHNYAYCLGASADFTKIYACTCGRGLFRGIASANGQIAWNFGDTAYAKESHEDDWLPRNAKEAKKLIFSGEFYHRH